MSEKSDKYTQCYAFLKDAALNTVLQPHQQRVVDRLKTQPGLVVAHGLGTGKTLSSIAAIDAFKLPSTVVVPAALKTNYSKELTQHRKEQGSGVSITSLQKLTRGKNPVDVSNHLLVVDEAHKLREPSGHGRRVFNALKPAKRMLLTASPIYNHPADLASLVNLASGKKLLPETRQGFEKAFTRTVYTPPSFFGRLTGKKPVPHKVLANTKHLKKVLHKWVDYHEGEDRQHFPSSTAKIIKVPLSAKQQTVNDALLKKAPKWIQHKIRSGLPPTKKESTQLNAFLGMQRQVSNSPQSYVHGMTLDEAVTHSPKIQTAFKNFQTALSQNPHHKAVVYSNYLQSGLHPYTHLLKQHNIPYGVFSGEMPKPVRDQLVKDYNSNKIKALLVSTAGAEGLDLKGTRQIQVLDPHFNNEKINQVIGRGIRYKSHAHLPKEHRHVNVEHYLAVTKPKFVAFGKPDMSADEYIHARANDKTTLNDQFKALLKTPHTKIGEYAPGIPDRNVRHALPAVHKPQTWQLSLQEHHADVAGHHLDLRLIDPKTNHAHSWALPKAMLPEPGKSVLAVPQPTHTADYARTFGKDKEETIEHGYGKGRVKLKALEDVDLFHSKPEESGTRVRFNRYTSKGPEEFAIVATRDGQNLLVNKTLSRSRLPHLDFGTKPKTRDLDVSKVDVHAADQVMMPKYDGAHTLLDLNKAERIPRLFSYRTPKRHTAGVIEHTHKVPELLTRRVPKELKGTVLRTETIAVDSKGKALPASAIAGLLNATVPNSRSKQDELKAELRTMILDVEKYKGKAVMEMPFKERYELAKQVGAKLDLPVADIALSASAKQKMLKRIESGKHPMTTEGVVLRPWETSGNALKAKFRPDHDVHVRRIFEATDTHGGSKGRAGGFEYSWTPKGPIAGRVGTGFNHTLATDMHQNPDRYIGRVAKVEAEQRYPSGALGKASFKEWHLDKGKTASVVGHVAGPSGAGKTTLLQRLKEQHPRLVVKDLDEIDEQAEHNLGYTARKTDYSDKMLSRLAREKQKVLDSFLTQNKKQPILLGGHHTEAGHVLRVPTNNLWLLSTPHTTGVQRRLLRDDAASTQSHTQLLRESRDTVKELKALGYTRTTPTQIERHVKKILDT